MNKDRIPKESETIAARHSARFARKLMQARKRMTTDKKWWSNAASESFFLFLIFSLNVFMIASFWQSPVVNNTFSGPAMPLLIKLVEYLNFSTSTATQLVSAFFYLLLPFSIYFFVRFITERKMTAIFTSIIVSLPFYPFAKTRIISSFFGTDAAHIASLAVIPIGLYGILRFVRHGGAINLIMAALASAVVALISPFGFMIYMIFALITGFSEMLLGKGRLKLFRMIVVFMFAGGLCSFWYNPGFFFWMISGPMGQEIRFMISKFIPISFFVVPALGVFGYLLFDRKPTLQPVFLASFFTITFLLISLAGGGVVPSHPSRYVYELGISFSFLVSIIIVSISDYVRLSKKIGLSKMHKTFLANGMLLLSLVILVAGVVFGKNQMITETSNVLGMWEGVQKGDIWLARDRFGGLHAFAGHTITGVSVLGLLFMSLKVKDIDSDRSD